MSPVARGKADLPSCGLEGHAHGMIPVHTVRVLGKVAVVVFEIVYAPLGKQLRVLKFMVIAGWIPGTGKNPGAGIHAELQPFFMDVISHRFHAVRKFLRIRNQIALPVPLF